MTRDINLIDMFINAFITIGFEYLANIYKVSSTGREKKVLCGQNFA